MIATVFGAANYLITKSLVNGNPLTTLKTLTLEPSQILPDMFCGAVVTPMIKKGKYKSKCSSYRSVTVLPVMRKLLVDIFDEITEAC